MKKLNKIVMVVDEKEQCPGQAFKIIGEPCFSPDGNHIAYHAMLNKNTWKLIVDGHVLDNNYSGFIKTTPIIYDTSNHFHTIGVKNSAFVLIDVEIPEESKIESSFK